MTEPDELLIDHRQIRVEGVDVDEGLSVFLQVLWARGLHTRSSCQGGGRTHDTTMAFVIFPAVEEATYFLVQSAVFTDFKMGDRMVMSIQHPLTDLAGTPEGKVTWLPEWTPLLTKLWGQAA